MLIPIGKSRGVPPTVVEVVIVVGDLGAVQPIDWHAPAVHRGVGDGVDGRRAAHHPEVCAVLLDVRVACGDEVLHKRVVVRYVRRRCVSPVGGLDEQPEAVSRTDAVGNQGPVAGHLRFAALGLDNTALGLDCPRNERQDGEGRQSDEQQWERRKTPGGGHDLPPASQGMSDIARPPCTADPSTMCIATARAVVPSAVSGARTGLSSAM